MSRAFVWVGGAMFVASLTYWAFWFLSALGQSGAGRGVDGSSLTFDAALFTLFAAHHSILAREPVKRALAFIPPELTRSVFVWTASVLLIVLCVFWRPIGGVLYRVTGVAAVACAIVQLAGAAFIAAS